MRKLSFLSSSVAASATSSSLSLWVRMRRVATVSVPPSALHSKRHYALCGCNGGGGGGWRRRGAHVPSPVSLSGHFLQRRHASFNKFDAVSYVGRARNVANAFNPLEMNLFDDPTGGLTAGPAEELSTTEIEHQVRLHVASYSRSIFYLLYTPFVDVISVVLERGLVPESARPGEVMCRWFTDGALTLQNPSCVEEGMGAAAWGQLCEGLDAFYADVEPVMPLTAAARKHGLAEELLVPFLRQLSMELLVPGRRRAALEILPGLVLGLANGRAPAALGFPADNQRARAVMAADLFFGVGQETGNTDFAYLGIQLLRANDIPVPFLKQKQLTNVFSAATRIQTDWQMRVSGQLVEVLPKWMEYYKKVHHDNLQMMKKLSESDAAIASEKEKAEGAGVNDSDNSGARDGSMSKRQLTAKKDSSESAKGATTTLSLEEKANNDGVHDYFSSNCAEKLMRLSDLESRILQSVRNRDQAWRDDTNKLYYRFKRRRYVNEEQKTGETIIMREMSLDDSFEDLDAEEDVDVAASERQETKETRKKRRKTRRQLKDDDDDDGARSRRR